MPTSVYNADVLILVVFLVAVCLLAGVFFVVHFFIDGYKIFRKRPKNPENPDFIVSSQTNPKTNRKIPINHTKKGYPEEAEE